MINNGKFMELINNKEFVEIMLAQDTPEEVQALFAKNGIDASMDEIDELGKSISFAAQESSQENLSEAELENVVGGAIEWIVVGKIIVAVGGAALSVYKWYKSRK